MFLLLLPPPPRSLLLLLLLLLASPFVHRTTGLEAAQKDARKHTLQARHASITAAEWINE
jgi:hypothetical protein